MTGSSWQYGSMHPILETVVCASTMVVLVRELVQETPWAGNMYFCLRHIETLLIFLEVVPVTIFLSLLITLSFALAVAPALVQFLSLRICHQFVWLAVPYDEHCAAWPSCSLCARWWKIRLIYTSWDGKERSLKWNVIPTTGAVLVFMVNNNCLCFERNTRIRLYIL